MNIFGANISHQSAQLLGKELEYIQSFDAANEKLFGIFHIKQFFGSEDDYANFKTELSTIVQITSEPDRAEYGDFQTPTTLARSIAAFLKEKKQTNPKCIIEPTCGKGHFIIASVATFNEVERIIGIEIHKPYIWETKFNIIDFYLSNPEHRRPEIEIRHTNVFDVTFEKEAISPDAGLLILGNPPWVTSAKLGSLGSDNLPRKSNFKKHSGLDAITGKGNFDIGEYITTMLIKAFQHHSGTLAFLVKNTVIKNIVSEQVRQQYQISGIEKLTIDSKKEFDASVEASLLYCCMNSKPEYTCTEYSFYNTSAPIKTFGWVRQKFVSDVGLYHLHEHIDGQCPFEWRQGIKHDLSTVMELEKDGAGYVNGRKEHIDLEEDLVFGLLKSSDLKQQVIDFSRKYTIMTQKQVGQETSFIRQQFPKIFNYLVANKPYFDQRKSSIYNNKPAFSIFGVGDYSFAPYKVAISGLYKVFMFSLVLPYNGKPIMLDDTCYLLGFDNIEFAAYTSILLNSKKSVGFLQSITFADAKRTFTKDVLMRIDLLRLSEMLAMKDLEVALEKLNSQFGLNLSVDQWDAFVRSMQIKRITRQTSLFD